ncbi:helix-turn-helix domain-containing protein [Micromonospora sp. NPDC005173]|uniref:helix-turn-helix domain-containing protein n=1 Tax=Micromonospora sp. NPDC005173 TaxID=3157165 RepID=UPI0033AEEA08
MARSIPADRFAVVVDAAARVFIAHGYRRTQVQDVADALGLAKGTLYGYAQNKTALFAAAVRYADGHEPLPAVTDLPVPAPADADVAALVAGRLGAEIADLRLHGALAEPAHGTADTDPDELGGIVTDLYQRLARHRVAIKLVDRCAPELPDLAEIWFGTGRRAQVDALAEYLTRRADTGAIALPGPATLLARTIVELVTLWAVHRHFDPAPPTTGAADPAADDATVTAMLAALLNRATAPASPHRSR